MTDVTDYEENDDDDVYWNIKGAMYNALISVSGILTLLRPPPPV